LFNVGERQLDLILKYMPLIIFIYPILSWLDSRKRFSHNAKFYSDRASSVKNMKKSVVEMEQKNMKKVLLPKH